MKKVYMLGVAILLVISLLTLGTGLAVAHESSDKEQKWVDLWFDGQPVTTYDSSIIPGVADAEHSHVACIVHFDASGSPVEGEWFVVTNDMEAVADAVFNNQEMREVKPSPTPAGSRTDAKMVSVQARGTRTAHARQTMRCVVNIPLTYQETWQTFTYNGTNVTQVSGQGGFYYAETFTGWQWTGGYWYDYGPTPPASYHGTYSWGSFWNDALDMYAHLHRVKSTAYGNGSVSGSYGFSGEGPPFYSLVQESWYD